MTVIENLYGEGNRELFDFAKGMKSLIARCRDMPSHLNCHRDEGNDVMPFCAKEFQEDWYLGLVTGVSSTKYINRPSELPVFLVAVPLLFRFRDGIEVEQALVSWTPSNGFVFRKCTVRKSGAFVWKER